MVHTFTMEEAERWFLEWMKENGADMDAVAWPRETESGSRGTVCTRGVASGEALVVIPERLMMTRRGALGLGGGAGEALAALPRLLASDDNVLAVYFMHEWLLGEESFYCPYLRTISVPRDLGSWSPEAIDALQDRRRLIGIHLRRQNQLRILWERTFDELEKLSPGLFPRVKYAFELYEMAWGVIRARAFGRRLPWSALVPGADLLNHGNVQTKYELKDGYFRLFPSGNNCYAESAEALNSYGRRPNDNLLLDYGFCLLDNEWEEVVLSPSDLLGSDCPRLQLLRRISGAVKLRYGRWSSDLVELFRLAQMRDSEIEQTINGDLLWQHSQSLAREGEEADEESARTAKAIQSSRDQLRRILDEYETSAEDDEKELGDEESKDGSEKCLEKIFALRFRITRKRILKWHIGALEYNSSAGG